MFSCIIHNIQKLMFRNNLNTQQLVSMDKQTVVYEYNGILFNYKSKWNSHTSFNMEEPWKYIRLKKPETKGHILYNSI